MIIDKTPKFDYFIKCNNGQDFQGIEKYIRDIVSQHEDNTERWCYACTKDEEILCEIPNEKRLTYFPSILENIGIFLQFQADNDLEKFKSEIALSNVDNYIKYWINKIIYVDRNLYQENKNIKLL